MNTPKLHKVYIFLFGLWFGLWFGTWFWPSINTLNKEKEYYRFMLRGGSEKLKGFWTAYDQDSQDYYRILKACDKLLPPQAEITLLLPLEPSKRFQFFEGKGRYILYPRNYGENNSFKKYILVYGVSDFSIPSGYEVIKYFSHNKYLLKRKTRG